MLSQRGGQELEYAHIFETSVNNGSIIRSIVSQQDGYEDLLSLNIWRPASNQVAQEWGIA
jgi:carboxylesterase type B